MKLPISKRLLCCAAQVPQNARVADIGTDHGYLPIALLRSGRASYVHACDLRPMPLRRARENAARFGVTERIRFSCADGLAAVAADTVDTIVCAGMGGDLISGIIADCPWLRDEKYLLILQPQSSGNDLRRRLGELGFGIERETLVEDGGFIYFVICARFGGGRPLSPGEQYLSAQLLHSGDALLPRYLSRIVHALTLTVEGIAKANDPAARERLSYYEQALREVRKMEEEL